MHASMHHALTYSPSGGCIAFITCTLVYILILTPIKKKEVKHLGIK